MPHADPVKRAAYLRRYRRQWKRRLVARWRAAGACVSCGEPVTGHAECFDCRWKRRERHRKVYRPKLTRPCVDCHKPATSGAVSHTGRCRKCQCRYALHMRWRFKVAA